MIELKLSSVRWCFICSCIFCFSSLIAVDYTPNEVEDLVSELDKPIPVTAVSALLWKKAYLPCDITPKQDGDLVFMVLWFKNSEPEPIYSFDTRNRPYDRAKLWSSSNAFGSRAVFRASFQPARLIVDNVQAEDEAVYKCRVDYKDSPTTNVQVNFTVIVLPGRPMIYDEYSQEVATLMDPRNEGNSLTLYCEVYGGRPSPTVSWYLENKLIDDSYNAKGSSLIENQLTALVLTREHHSAQLTCQASNTNLTAPVSKLVILNINLKPLKAEILHKSRALSAEKEYEIECLAVGSKPVARITWSIEGRQMKHLALKFPSGENQVISIVKYYPQIEDNSKQLVCIAENPSIPDSQVEDSWILNIYYSPRVSLRIGRSLNPKTIKEGEDVYFDCVIKANPKIFRQTWYRNGVPIQQNVTGGVILTDNSLVLQKVSRQAAGNYTCSAYNQEGQGVSNSVPLQIKYAPTCKVQREQLYGASTQETVVLKCEVDSNPKPTGFWWTYNSSTETRLVHSFRYTHSDFISIIRYTPVYDVDYGTLACWAKKLNWTTRETLHVSSCTRTTANPFKKLLNN